MPFILSVVYQKITPELKQEIVSMWLNAKVLDIKEANRRVDEVVVTARNELGELVGVTSVDIKQVDADSSYYFFRMFVKEEYRGRHIPRKTPIMSNLTVDFLSTYEVENKPKGVVAVLDNPKLSNKIMETFGWSYYGQGPLGKHLWYKNFKD